MKRIVVTGAAGQVGSEMVAALRERYGRDAVLATDIREPDDEAGAGPFRSLDVTDAEAVADVIRAHGADCVYHLAALLSARGEKAPQKAWAVNMGGLYNVLEVAREEGCAVFTPSSIAAFGPSTPPDPTPQDTIQRPNTIYGVSKVAGELLSDYYHHRFGVDARGVRYPGLISHVTPPGGGTTDFAVEIYYEAVKRGEYTCFVGPETQLDMMYMPDAIRGSIELMEASPDRLIHRNAFNITAMQVTPESLAASISDHVPGFRLSYEVDPVRQAIADSWPRRIDDRVAREEWGWIPEYDLASMTADMLAHLRARLE
ncbi:MAG: NAD-dependent epimerase/dehydratase family protein [Candidatus Palauibacterales bacterium]|nr:NAD-dependent epimerase/dehydratase family protein [Candidatus Palauibacterales bacterium]